MDSNKVNFWLSANAAYFSPEVLPAIKSKLDEMDDTQMMYLQNAKFNKPSTIFLIAIFLGLERFFLGDIAMGAVKVITGYGCGIWWLIDIFSAKKRAMKYNYEQFQKTTMMISGSGAKPATVASQPLSQTQPAAVNTQVAEMDADSKGSQQQSVAASASDGRSIISVSTSKLSEYSQQTTKQLLPIVEKVKRVLLSPASEWEKIDEENATVSKTLTSYLLLLAAIPAVISLLGYFFYGIFGALPFGTALGLGIRVAIMIYAVIVGGALFTALVSNLLAENFGSVKDFNKAFALAAHAWTPLCVAGVLLIYPVSFLFWIWAIAGIAYGLFLLYSGIRPLLKTPLEQLTPYVAICAAGFIAAFFLLIVVLSLMFLGGIYFSLLSGLNYLSNFKNFY